MKVFDEEEMPLSKNEFNILIKNSEKITLENLGQPVGRFIIEDKYGYTSLPFSKSQMETARKWINEYYEMEKMKNRLIIDGKEIELSSETINNIKKAIDGDKEIIKCPFDIEKLYWYTRKNGLGVVFNKETYYYESGEPSKWSKKETSRNEVIPCKFVECERKDIEPGDIIYVTDLDIGEESFENIFQLGIYLGETVLNLWRSSDGYCIEIESNETLDDWGYYYKVVPIDKEDL